MPDPLQDSLVVAGRFELLGGSQPSSDADFPNAIFRLQPGYDTSAPLTVPDFLTSLTLDGERPVGRRASNRTMTLGVDVEAPDFATLASAIEELFTAIDQPYWTLAWTRKQGTDPVQLPLIYDCFRAHQTKVQGGGVDGYNATPIARLELSFDAKPYGRSDAPVTVALASPVPGGPTAPAPVVLDTFSSVTTTGGFSSSSQHVLDAASAKWDHTAGFSFPAYSKSGLSLNLTGLTVLAAYVGFGADYPPGFLNPVVVHFTLTSGAKTIKFSVTQRFTPSNDASVAHFARVSAAIPQGVAGFNYAAVTGYSISVSNAPSSTLVPGSFGYNTWYNHVVANPPSLQVAATRGYVYNLYGVYGSARAPVSVTAQQPGAAVTEIFDTPGPLQYTAPTALTGGVGAVTCIGGGGAGASVTGTGQGGGGKGAECAVEPTLVLTAGAVYSAFVGHGGTPLTGIATLAITTVSLPNGTQSSVYPSTQMGATGGTGPYTWSITAGTLPTGLSMSSAGLITGTPTGTTAGTSITFHVVDSLGAAANLTLNPAIKVVATGTFTITTTSLPAGSVGALFSSQLATTGGTGAVTWMVTVGTLPPGLTLNSATGLISGLPTAAGTTTFTVQATDSAGTPRTDVQVLVITVTLVTTSTKPRFGANAGANYPNGSGVGTNWQVVYNHLQVGGQDFGWRQYGPRKMPIAWDDGVTPPNDATFVVISWKPDINATLNHQNDAAIDKWAASCQKQWDKNPNSLYMSLWHEGGSLSPGSGGNPTSDQILQLHAYVYPRFKRLAPKVPYGQIETCAAIKASPNSWVSCKNNPNLSNGSNLDFYFTDGYTPAGGPQPVNMHGAAWDKILALYPNATLGIAEANDYNAGAPTWWENCWQLANDPKYTAEVFMPFWDGTDNGRTICFSSTDSTQPGTNAEIISIINRASPASAVKLGQDPPAVDGQSTTFPGDAVPVVASGGQSATGSAGATVGTASTNTSHHPGGNGAAGGAGGGASPGTPHAVTAVFAAAAGSTLTPQVPVTGATATGEAILAITSSNSGVVNSVSDTKGNLYQNVASTLFGAFHLDFWLATQGPGGGSTPAVALTTSDKILPVWGFTSAAQGMLVNAVSGITPGQIVDVVKANTGSSTAMSTGSSGVLAQASEWAVAAFVSGNGGGAPSALTGGGFAAVTGSPAHVGATQYLAAVQQVTAATTALTASGTVVSTTWSAIMITIPFATTGATVGGGGGSAGGQATNGNPGAGNIGGIGPDIAGDGGNGSLDPLTPPADGQWPGGAGGGACSVGDAMQGGFGADGGIFITRSTSQETFKSLLLHIPGPDAPQSLSPLITLGTPGVAGDGNTEYPVPSLVPGIFADFDGTYTIVAAATKLASPTLPRTVTVTVRQRAYPGGPFYETSAYPREFIPVEDVTANGLVVIGALTLPHKDVAEDNTQGSYSVLLLDDNLQDIWSDLMLLDTAGETVVIDSDVDAYSAYYVDEPAPDRDWGRIMGTNGLRSAAISVSNKCLAISGEPLCVYPGDNQILAWSNKGPPQLSVKYIPRWFNGRTV